MSIEFEIDLNQNEFPFDKSKKDPSFSYDKSKVLDDIKIEEDDEERPSVRWAPLGAISSPEPQENNNDNYKNDNENENLIKRLEDEQEKLTSSLALLTNHFAQIQLRLKQLADDKSSNIDDKLKELEDFANKGVPDVWSLKYIEIDTIEKGKECQAKVITELKKKLEEIESYAYQSGNIDEPPTSKVLANQKFIMEQLRVQLDINFEQLANLNESELRASVNNAIHDIINPGKVREKMVDQLKTQITDLERFIEYLQDDGIKDKRNSFDKNSESHSKDYRNQSKKIHHSATEIIRKALNLLQLIAASQFGCHIKEKKKLSRPNFQSDVKNESMHWGDTRAALEVTIEKIIEITNQTVTEEVELSDLEDVSFAEILYDSDEEKVNFEIKRKLLSVVRKEFCPLLMKLIQHGMTDSGQISHLSKSISCFSGRSDHFNNSSNFNSQHAWDVIRYFYQMKNGTEVVNSPACKLSESFYLSNVGGKEITTKEKLLKAVGIILESHSIFKRSKDTQFKAFICLALNEKCLYEWLKIVLKNRVILYSFYDSWSYAHKMGFDDTLHSLRRLSDINFDLPYDVSVRQLYKIKDAF